MERLTRRGEDGKGYFKALDPDCTCNRECPRLWEHMQMLSDRLAAYEDTGLTPDEIAILNDGCEECEIARRDFEFMHEFQDIDHIRSLVQAEQEGRLVVLDEPREPLVWGDDNHDTILCPNCEHDLMGGFPEANSCETTMYQCPYCGQSIDGTKALTREEAEAALEGGDDG